jgi:hypothetical protein
MLIPLYGFVTGDSLGLVVLVHDNQKVRELVLSLQNAASPRVRPAPKAKAVFRGRVLDREATIAQSGLEPLDRVDVVPEGSHGV